MVQVTTDDRSPHNHVTQNAHQQWRKLAVARGVGEVEPP